MKKILSLLLALIMCLTVLTACDVQGTIGSVVGQIQGFINDIFGDDPVEEEYHIDKAESFLKNMYKDVNPVTGADYEVVGQVRVAGVAYTVTWESNSEQVVIVALENGNYLVDLNEKATEDVAYVLTATITAGNGETATVTYNRTIPKYNVLSWDAYMAAQKGDVVLIEGIVVAMNAKSLGNSRNHLFLMDASGKGGYYVYQMDEDPVEAGVKVGMTVSVSGPVEPYSGMHEIKGGTFTIVDETIKEVAPIDITDLVVAGTVNYGEYVALPVTIKGVTLGAQDMTKDSSQYLYFTLPDAKGTQAYVRTYVTDFPTTLDAKTATADNADKAAIDALHKEHFGDKADVTGILILYSGNPYLIPMSVDCFTNFVTVELTDADKIAAEVDGVSVVEGIFADTVIDLPTVGQYFDDVTISWTSDNAAAVVGADGKLTVTLGEDAVTVTLTAVYTCGETTETKTYVIEVAAIVKTFNQVVDTPVAGNEYYFMMHQGNLNSDLFLTGEMSGYYYATTEDVSKAVKVKVVDAGEGAYYLMVGEKYATIVKNGNYINVVFVEEAPEAKFTWNADLKTFVINVDGTDYFYGTKADGTYATMDKCKLENAANSFVANLVLVKMSTDGEIKMTADNMGLGDYAAGSVDVEGFTMGYTEIGSYGDGIQMRIKEGRVASLWNETEFSFPIKEIVLVYSETKSTYDNTGAFAFTFGNVMGGADYTVKLDTVKGTKTYTITPDAETYTYFKMELLLTYSFYWDSITVVLTDGNIVHEHEYTSEVVAPTCEDKGYTLHTCACGESYKDTSVNALGHNFVEGVCATCELALVNTTVAGANELAKGTWVVVTGTVIRIDSAWSEQYKNITVTIADGDSTLYLYRLSTNVAVGDIITVTGKVDEYNGSKQIAQGATAVIVGKAEEPAHECESVCPTCEKCTDTSCTEDVCAEKCEGHEVVEEPEVSANVVLTVDSLGIAAQSYAAGTATVNGVAFEFVQIGNYGNGLQMRDKDGKTSILWNTSAFSAPIARIELVYSATQSVAYSNANAVIFTFGTAVEGHTYTTKLSTTAGVKTYTITPDAETYTYFKLEHDLGYSMYWDSITIVLADGSVVNPPVVEPEVPAHTCDHVCDTCKKCTDNACTETVCAEKCEGHETNTEVAFYEYTMKSGDFSANGTKKLGDLEWTLAGDGGYWGWDNNTGKGIQFGSKNNPYKSMTLTSASVSNVKKIVISTSGASSIAGTLTVTVNGVQVGEAITLTSSNTEYTFELNEATTGEIVFTYTQTTSKALYIKSISIYTAE